MPREAVTPSAPAKLRPETSRHLTAVAVTAVLVAAFSVIHGEWSPVHRWNRAFGDASFVLVAIAMAIGPLARLWRPATKVLPLRRQLGIYGCLAAAVHAVIVLVGWVQLDLWRLMGFELRPQLGDYVMVQPGFGLANTIGIAALALASILAATSNDASLHRLGSSAWKFLQMGVLPLWWLSVAHVGYFLFAHFKSFHRPVPDPNPLQWWAVALVIAVLTLRSASFLKTCRRQNGARQGRPPEVNRV